MSQPEENREKSAKTDAVLRPPAATGGPARPRPPEDGRNRTDEVSDRSAPQPEEEA